MDRGLELSRWFSRRAVPAIGGLIVAANVFMAGVLLVSASEQNAFSRALTTTFVQERYATMSQHLREVAKDYSGWDDAYRNLNDTVNLGWAITDDNFGANFFTALDIDHVYVLDATNRTKLAVVRGKPVDEAADAVFGANATILVERARTIGAGRSVPVIATLFSGTQAVLFVATALTSGDAAPRIEHPETATVVLMGRTLTPTSLGDVSGRSSLPDLRVIRQASQDGPRATVPAGPKPDALSPSDIIRAGLASVRIDSIPSDPPALIVWSPPRPGTRLLWLLLPWIALAAAALCVLAALILRHAATSARAIEGKIAEVASARDEAHRLSFEDIVTGLPNRSRAIQHLSRALAAEVEIAVLFLDLDRFKPVNDAFGHSVGDIALKEVGRRLVALSPDGALVARIGGDEFLIVLPDVAAERVAAFCETLIAEVRRPIRLDACEVHLGLSIGIACAPEDADEPLELIRRSDLAMFQAKRAGRNTYLRFTPQMNERIRDRPELERDLWRGLEAGEFELHYQPRFSCRTLELAGFEALLRWKHPIGGMMSPRDFLELAEETGAIHTLGAFAIRAACAAVAPLPGVNVSVNLSSSQFRNGKVIDTVEAALAETGLAASRLELEVTETVLIEDSASALSVLQALKRLGVQLSLDDFGTGYSALGYLRRFPFDRLKIDRQFVGDLSAAGESRAIVQAIIGLARALKLAVTAEGVETAEQLMLLKTDQCDEVQGFLLGRPVPASELRLIVDTARAGPAVLTGASAPGTAHLSTAS